MSYDTENIDPRKMKFDLGKIKETVKRDKEFDLIEHELIKFTYIFEEIVKNPQENKGTDGMTASTI